MSGKREPLCVDGNKNRSEKNAHPFAPVGLRRIWSLVTETPNTWFFRRMKIARVSWPRTPDRLGGNAGH